MGNLVAFIILWTLFIVSTMGAGLLLVPVYWALVFRNSDERVKKAKEKLSSTLMENERLIGAALQMRLSSLMSRRQLVGITTSRVIQINRPLFGGFSMEDHQWKDLLDAKLSENTLPDWFGSRLTFEFDDAKNTEINGITSDSASRIYKEAQKQEQDWEEKRRVRALENTRAASGATLVNTGGPAVGSATDTSLDEITKAKQMLESGVISDVEFSEIKAKILSRGQF